MACRRAPVRAPCAAGLIQINGAAGKLAQTLANQDRS
jgi:hypothetical protein